MGIAILLTDTNFSDANLGQVTLSNPIAVQSISLNNNISSFIGPSFKLAVDFAPVNTTERGVVWSITSGGSYATIDSSTGDVTVGQNANGNTITIQVTSTSNGTLIATHDVVVTYNENEVSLISWIKTGGANYVQTNVAPNSSYSYEARFSPQGVFGSSPYVFGSRTGLKNNECSLRINTNGATIYLINSKTNKSALVSGMVANKIYKAEITQTSPLYCSVWNETDNVGVSINQATDALDINDFATSEYPIALFSLRTSNSYAPDSGFVKIYEFKVKQGSTVIADYVPALVDGTPVFFDKVSRNICAVTGSSEITHE